MKTAYELALERMESDGIERPREEAYSSETLTAMEEVRQRAAAKLAELEILHRKKLGETPDPAARALLEKDYRAERDRIAQRRDREIDGLRGDA